MLGFGYYEEGKICWVFKNDDCMVYGLLCEEWECDLRFYVYYKIKYFLIERYLLVESIMGFLN